MSVRSRRDPRRISESSIQKMLTALLRSTARRGVVWFAIPNELPKIEGRLNHFLACGMKPGVADMAIVIDGKLHCLELKAKKGVHREAQKTFQLECELNGIPYALARSFDEAKAVLEIWGALKGVVMRRAA